MGYSIVLSIGLTPFSRLINCLRFSTRNAQRNAVNTNARKGFPAVLQIATPGFSTLGRWMAPMGNEMGMKIIMNRAVPLFSSLNCFHRRGFRFLPGLFTSSWLPRALEVCSYFSFFPLSLSLSLSLSLFFSFFFPRYLCYLFSRIGGDSLALLSLEWIRLKLFLFVRSVRFKLENVNHSLLFSRWR